jgi:hypothetical protein
VAIFHAVDRAAEEKGTRSANLRQGWSKESLEVKLVDIIAHHFKHVQSSMVVTSFQNRPLAEVHIEHPARLSRGVFLAGSQSRRAPDKQWCGAQYNAFKGAAAPLIRRGVARDLLI